SSDLHSLVHHGRTADIVLNFLRLGVLLQAVLKMLDDYGVPKEMIAFDDFGG
ncbi:MAG: hypothetical protein HGA23_08570, partial [Bacteroidales bacterium]|nr:hypothetical protein [Bacteroidales bacterium]